MSALHTRRNPSSAATSVRETPLYEGPCRTDPDFWFPDKKKDLAAPKAICKKQCPFVEQCLQAALDFEGDTIADGRYGVWGGLAPTERAVLATPRPRR